MKAVQFLALGFLFLVCAALGQQIIALSLQNQVRKTDYAEISNIKYGLFSINQWKSQLSEIINAEVADFDPRDNKAQLKPLIEQQLLKLIDVANERIKEKNKESFKGKLKQAFINTFVDLNEIKSGVPQYAEEIFQLMQKPSTKKSLKSLVVDKVETYFEKTFEEQDLSAIEQILAKLDVKDVSSAKDILGNEIAQAQKKIFLLTWMLIGLATLLFAIVALSGVALPSSHFLLLVLILFVLLIGGVTTPMIDLEAKISEMSFMLMNHEVKFLDQVLYFQTKSVVDVFWLMITDEAIQMQIVGVLMVLFSIIFPVGKLIASILFHYDHANARQSKVIQFFVLKSGKWSMTDVMIIAIFMAYIGFNGVIASQFGKLHTGEEEIVLLTTNGTSLQSGFYLFLAYAVLALFLSEFLLRKVEQKSLSVPKPQT